ncbi:hypothetical protein D3C75_1340270 [compost metagenome]
MKKIALLVVVIALFGCVAVREVSATTIIATEDSIPAKTMDYARQRATWESNDG